jgi:hypothetical protein
MIKTAALLSFALTSTAFASTTVDEFSSAHESYMKTLAAQLNFIHSPHSRYSRTVAMQEYTDTAHAACYNLQQWKLAVDGQVAEDFVTNCVEIQLLKIKPTTE